MNHRDQAMRTASMIGTAVINALIFTSMAIAGVLDEDDSPPEPPVEWINVQPMELPRLGEERPPEALPRIIEAPEPPPPETDTASLSRQKKEEELERKKEKEKKERELAEKKRRDEEKRKKELERKEKEDEEKAREKRKKAMEYAMRKLERDRRADEDAPPGFEDGDKMGNSADPNARLHKATYMNRVVFAIQQQFTVPSVIPKDLRKKLSADLQFRIDKHGKLEGEPSVKRSSGNRLFDQAALRALRKFGPGSKARIPVPPRTLGDLRRSVLKNGLTIKMRGER